MDLPASFSIGLRKCGSLSHLQALRSPELGCRIPFGTLDWEYYEREERRRPVDDALIAGGDVSACYGVRQVHVPLSHRQNILCWMGVACMATEWSYATFFTAAYTFDWYVLTANHQIASDELASLAASCLYFGARLRESMADNNLLSFEEFRKICPDIGSGYVLRSQETHLIEQLKGYSIGNQTPYDIAQTYIQWMGRVRSTRILYKLLYHTDTLDELLECMMQVSNVCLLNSISLCMPASSWVACTLVHVAQVLCREVLDIPDLSRELCSEVMQYPGGYDALRKLLGLYRPLITLTFYTCSTKTAAARKKSFLFRLFTALSKSDVCHYKSPIVASFRKALLPTLIACGEAPRRVFDKRPSSGATAQPAAAQENLPPVLTHKRRHTNLCDCPQCKHYTIYPPDWRLMLLRKN